MATAFISQTALNLFYFPSFSLKSACVLPNSGFGPEHVDVFGQSGLLPTPRLALQGRRSVLGALGFAIGLTALEKLVDSAASRIGVLKSLILIL